MAQEDTQSYSFISLGRGLPKPKLIGGIVRTVDLNSMGKNAEFRGKRAPGVARNQLFCQMVIEEYGSRKSVDTLQRGTSNSQWHVRVSIRMVQATKLLAEHRSEDVPPDVRDLGSMGARRLSVET